MIRRIVVFAIALTLVALASHATTFVVPSDRSMVTSTPAIVIGHAVTSYTRLNDRGGIETITSVEIETVLKGVVKGRTITVREPGGRYGDKFQVIASVPHFRDGERVILFLHPLPGKEWIVSNLALGKFSLAKDKDGRNVAIRQEKEIHGWTSDGARHHERRRDAAQFIAFIRSVASGAATGEEEHFLPFEKKGEDTDAVGLFSASSYLFAENVRWSSFPQTFTYTNTLEGAPNGGVNAIVAALAMWSNNDGSSVKLQLAPESRNTISWEQDLLARYGVAPYACDTGGVMGIGSITGSVVMHSGPGGASFNTATAGDVNMNEGLANCTTLFESTVFVNGLAHEIGHTLGLRHSDQDGSSDACAGGMWKCSDTAVMRSSIARELKATLQSYDKEAARVIYPNVSTIPAPPTNTMIYSHTATSISLSWSAPNGATSYRVYRRSGPGVYSFIANVPIGTSYVDETAGTGNAYQYAVTAVNAAGESGLSNADFSYAFEFTDFNLTAGIKIKLVHFTELRSAVNALRALAGLTAYSFAAPTPAIGVKVMSTHMTGLRTALNEARLQLGGGALTFADTVVVGTPIRAAQVSELRLGVF